MRMGVDGVVGPTRGPGSAQRAMLERKLSGTTVRPRSSCGNHLVGRVGKLLAGGMTVRCASMRLGRLETKSFEAEVLSSAYLSSATTSCTARHRGTVGSARCCGAVLP